MSRVLGIVAVAVGALLLLAPGTQGAFRGANGELVFVAGSEAGNQSELVASAANGNRFRQLVPRRYKVFESAVSPDGRRVAFSASVGAATPEIFITGLNGRGIRQLTRRGQLEEYYRQPAFSPDGRRIAYTAFSLGANRGRAIKVMRTNGSGKRNLVPPRVLEFFVEDPAFSPNGRRLAYTRLVRQDPKVSEIYSVNATSGAGERRLTDGLGSLNSYRDADYRPNGRVLVLETNPVFLGDRTRIVTINATSGNSPAKTLVESPDGWAYRQATYSPDGRNLLFSGENLLAAAGEQKRHLFTAQANGNGLRRVPLLFEAVSPAWGARPRR